jgi:outer membrane lipopolysaccharide assembly protein LptE/RlpB
MRNGVVAAALALAAACSLLGCGYHLSGRGGALPAHIKTIGVPAFTNATTRPELGQRITEKVIEQLAARGKYHVTPSSDGVDAVLTGSVKSWTSRPIAFTSNSSETTRAAVTLRASVRFQDLVAGTVPFEDEDYLFTKEYDVVGDPDKYFDTELTAVDGVADDFARAVVSAITQGF